MKNKKQSKNRIEKNLTHLAIIIITLFIILFGNIAYEYKKINQNQITGEVTGLERVSGF